MGSVLKLNAMKDLIALEKIDIFMVYETKISEKEMGIITQKIRSYEGTSISTVGICTLWKTENWELVQQMKELH